MTYSLAHAYLTQARADFESFTELKLSAHPASQWLHFLQMTMEKTGKAYLAASGYDLEHLRKSHLAFGRFMRILQRNRHIRNYWNLSTWQLQQHLKHILPLADYIERLAPALATGPNVEYPWKRPDGQLVVPCEHHFNEVLTNLESSRGRNLLKILERALNNHQWQKAFGIDLIHL